jgi:hypothetical protein
MKHLKFVSLAVMSLVLVFALATVAAAQQAVPRGSGGSSGGQSTGGTAVPRGGGEGVSSGGSGSSGGSAVSRGGGDMGSGWSGPARGTSGMSGMSGMSGRDVRGLADGQGRERAVPAQSRPRGDQPTQGLAVPRGSVVRPGTGGTTYYFYDPYSFGYGGYGGYYSPFSYWGSPYWSPFWGSGFGLGYGYWDPWMYGGYGYGGYGYGGYGYGGYGSGYGSGSRYNRAYELGSVRLKVRPREAEVLVDGYYVGQVDNFDGVFQRLELEPGPHRIEVRANGFQPMVFEVRVLPGRNLTYQGELQPVGR